MKAISEGTIKLVCDGNQILRNSSEIHKKQIKDCGFECENY